MEPLEKQDMHGDSHNVLEEQDIAGKTEAGRTEADPAQLAQERWQREQLRRGIGELPEKYRLVIHLYYYEELSTEEIARLLHKRSSTVRTQLVRAREQLRGILKKYGYDKVEELE